MLSPRHNRQKGVQGGVKREYFLECGFGNAEEGFRGSGFKKDEHRTSNVQHRTSNECIQSILKKTERSDSILRYSLFDILRFACYKFR